MKDHRVHINPQCHIVEGYSRNIIQDTFRGKYHIMPREFCNWICLINRKKLSDVCGRFGERSTILYRDYLDFSIKNEIITTSSLAIPFQEINLAFDIPQSISNAIILENKQLVESIYEVINLGCENIQILLSEVWNWTKIDFLLQLFYDSLVQHIELIVHHQDIFLNEDKWKSMFDKHKRLQHVFVFDSKRDDRIYADCFRYNSIVFVVDTFSFADCGFTHPLHFTNNLPFFTESQHHNTCLNRKICIDANGNIKNCPAMAKSFGNIKDTTLEEAINKPGFKDLWYICKDQIDVCKDCEFRYMCTDCRCFIKDPDNIYSQPAKCPYNPYICLWEGQEGYVPVEECGTYSRETGFVPDKERIKELNKQIWGE